MDVGGGLDFQNALPVEAVGVTPDVILDDPAGDELGVVCPVHMIPDVSRSTSQSSGFMRFPCISAFCALVGFLSFFTGLGSLPFR